MHSSLTRLSTPLSSSFFFCRSATPSGRYPLSLHDALPILTLTPHNVCPVALVTSGAEGVGAIGVPAFLFRFEALESERSEEHTSELQSHVNLVCRLLLEKKKVGNRTMPAAATHDQPLA